MSAPPPSTLPAGVRRGYALGGLASGSFGTVPGLLLMPYLTDVIGVGAAVAGAIVFAPKAWDFVCNPLAGRISDRSTHPAGRRRPFLLRAGLLMAVGFALIFGGPAGPEWVAALWVLLAFLGAATAYAFYQVPYLAMAAEMTDDYAERTRLMTWRVVVISLAIMISGATAPLVVAAGGGGSSGYRWMGISIGGLIVLGTLGVWWWTRRAVATRTEQAGGTLREQLGVVAGNPHLRTLLGGFVLQAVATSMLLAGVAYAARHVLEDIDAATALFVAFVGPAVLVAPAWGWLGLRLGKRRAYLAASAVLLVGLAGLVVTGPGTRGLMLVLAGVVGCGYAGAQLFPLAMLPDIAAEDARTTGSNRIGMLSGTWAGFELLGFALGPALLGLVLAVGGYRSGGVSDQPESALLAIRAGISVVPALLVLASLVLIARYRLDDRLHVPGREGRSARPSVTRG